MANHFTTVRITSQTDPATQFVGRAAKTAGGLALLNFISDILSGVRNGKIEVSVPSNTAHAKSTVTAGSVNGTVVLGGVSIAGAGSSVVARAADAVANLFASIDATVLALLGRVDYVTSTSTFNI